MLASRFCSLCAKEPPLLQPLKSKRLRNTTCRNLTNSEVRKKRNALFDKEKERQLSFVKRIEKINVQYVGLPEKCTLVMNKNLSTPYNCAMHMKEFLIQRSVLAVVNGKPWDMHRPLEEDCELRFLHMLEEKCHLQNKVFWRTCSFLLGHLLETSFKDEHYVELCSFPKANVESGSFVHDADLKLPNWTPTERELLCLSLEMRQMVLKDHPFERLTVSEDVAMEMFEDNRFKSQQIPNIAKQSEDTGQVNLYRAGDHIDVCRGPLISTTGQIGHFHLTAVHDIESEEYGKLKRFQGIALPRELSLHHWTSELLQKHAKRLNPAPIPGSSRHKYLPASEESEQEEFAEDSEIQQKQ